MTRLSISVLGMVMAATVLATAPRPQAPKAQDPPQLLQEEREDYFQKWLKQDVAYIITTDEKAVFQSLTTPEERERFIEQFWFRRDPDPRTPTNELKLEHYRRIAYANENFSAGWPGWMTDRGKIYIIHGPPDEVEANPSGGEYERTLPEGGGRTSVYPYEKWRYRYIEGVGSNVELEFVDSDFSGVYRLALSSEDKDAFLHVPNAGFTAAEELGLASRRQRPYYAPHATYPLMNYREEDSAFARYERYVDVQRPTPLENRRLKELVDTRITYQELPMTARVDVFRLNDAKALVPVTLRLENRDLDFQASGDVHTAKVSVYGVFSDLSGRVVREFEDQLVTLFNRRDLERGLGQASFYNRVLVMDGGSRYKLELVAKDEASGRVAVVRQALLVPDLAEPKLSASQLMISDYIIPAGDSERPEDQQFVVGNVQVRPSLDKVFSPEDYFAVYLQLYHVAIDQSTRNPSFLARYRIVGEGGVLLEETDETGESVQYFSPQRIVLIKRLPLNALAPGRYTVEVSFEDRLAAQTVTQRDSFQIR